MRTFLLKSIPFILSFLCGVALFVVSVYGIESDDWSALVNGISSSLLAIPIIFLVYNYADYKTSAKLNKTMADSMTYDINAVVLKLLIVFCKITGTKTKLTWKSIQVLLNASAADIRRSMKITKSDGEELRIYKGELDNLVYKAVKLSVLDPDQIQILSMLTRELSHVVNEQMYRGDKKMLAGYLANVFSDIDDWFDSCEREALQNHQHFQLAISQSDADKAKNTGN